MMTMLRGLWLRWKGKDGRWHDAPYPGGMRRWNGYGWEHRDHTLEELQDRIHAGW